MTGSTGHTTLQLSTTWSQNVNSRLSISREAFPNPMDAGKLVSWVYPILEHALFNFDGVKIACLVGTPHLQTCFSQFRWSENSLSGGNAPSSDMLCEIPMEWNQLVWWERPILRHALLNSDGVKSASSLIGVHLNKNSSWFDGGLLLKRAKASHPF